MYVTHACGCGPCVAAHTAVAKRYRLGKTSHRVPVHETAELLRAYTAQGHTMTAIAEITTLNETHLRKIRHGNQPTVHSDVAQLIRDARKHLGEPEGKRGDATGTRRRLQALAAVGWDLKAISDAAGIHRNAAQGIRSGIRPWCSAATRRKVAGFYDTHWDVTPTVTSPLEKQRVGRTLTLAARNGWLPPAAWDDDRIDDPTYTPNVHAIAEARSRDEWSADRIEELRHLITGGEAPEKAALRAGYPNLKAAITAVNHKGLTVLAHQLMEGRAA